MMKGIILWGSVLVLLLGWSTAQAQFIGTEACSECHDEQHENFKMYSKKAHSKHGIELMASDLDADELKTCFECHTTGYGQEGGFVSYKETPHLADVGCETCHGPGAEHAESGGDTESIARRPTIESCTVCHNASRVEDFDFKPLLFSGAH